MTRHQAAQFLWAARRSRHLCRFFILGWYSGSRQDVIAGSKWSMVDFGAEIMQRKETDWVPTKKQAPPFRVGDRLLSHLRRWRRIDGPDAVYIVHWHGDRINRPITSWNKARIKAGLPTWVTPHVLRHSRATSTMRAGTSLWVASKALGMSVKMLESTYGHHHPDWQKDAANVR